MKRHASTLILLAFIGGAAVLTVSAQTTPRMADGRPDLSGMWYRRVAGPVTERVGKSIVRVAGNPTVPDRYNPGTPKYKAELLSRVKELTDDQINVDPSFHCGPPGIVRIGPPQRIIQSAREIVILYDDLNGNFYRVVPIDGRRHREGIEPSSLGDSVGRWEGDTLVMEVRNILEDTWLGDNGLFHTENTKVTERLTRRGDTLTWEAIVENPDVFVEPWTVTPRTLTLMPDAEIEEAAFCEDRGVADRVTKDYHGNVR
jgi:hypothetical protein